MAISVLPPAAPVKKFSPQMLAVLMILSADQSLMRMVESHIDMAADEIRWDEIRKIAFSSGHFGAIALAYAIWTDQILEGSSPFDSALNMDLRLKRACHHFCDRTARKRPYSRARQEWPRCCQSSRCQDRARAEEKFSPDRVPS